VLRVRINSAGLFLPSTRLQSAVEEGEVLGTVIDPRSAQVVETVYANGTGRIVALRNQPVVSAGDLVARIQAVEAV
jgi:predicted deacylase